MLMYPWDAYPSFPVRVSGVSDSREEAQSAAASALLRSGALVAVTVTEVRADLTSLATAYRPTGTTLTGRLGEDGVTWAEAPAPTRELAS